MTTNAEKKARQKANREARLERAVRDEERRRQRQRLTAIGVLVAALALIVGLIWFATGTDDPNEGLGDDGTEQGAEDPTIPGEGDEPGEGGDQPTPTTSAEAVAPECPPAEGAAERTTKFTEAPPMCIDESATYLATVSTDRGDFTIELDATKAPETVNNFVFLARHKYYDGIPFHRIVPGFVIQGGDPTPVGSPEDLGALGSGGPGYQFEDELPESAEEYETMTVAMANSGPGTNGSQFFVVLEGGGEQLQPLYSLFGRITEGREVVEAIAATSVDGQTPTEVVRMNSVTITES